MADETKDQGAISNSGTDPKTIGVPRPQETEPEVQILEEHVTHAARKPTPSLPIKPPTKPVVPTSTMVPPPAIPKVNPEVPRPTPAIPIRPDAIANDVGLVLQPKKVPGPKTPPTPSPLPLKEKPLSVADVEKFTPPSTGEPALGDDIAKILAAVKLPERREAALPNEKKVAREPKKFDTSVAGSVLNEGSAPILPAQEINVSGTEKSAAPTQSPDGVKVIQRTPSSVTAVHTLKDDLQGVVHDQKMSLVKAVSLEEDRRAHKGSSAGESLGVQQRSKRTFGIIFASLTLLALGAGALFGVLFIMNQQKAPPHIDVGSSILFAEQSVLLSLDAQSPDELKRALEAGRTTSQGALGSVTRIIPVTAETGQGGTPQNRPATFKEFMAAIGAHPSDDLLRALGSDFFLGIHSVDKSSPLIVITVTSHARAFAAMLSWEESLNPDLAPLFTAVPVLKLDQNGVPSKRTYEDLVMRNYDVRALKDDSGEIQLYYSFPTQNILIIAESPYSFPEILSRLQASRQL